MVRSCPEIERSAPSLVTGAELRDRSLLGKLELIAHQNAFLRRLRAPYPLYGPGKLRIETALLGLDVVQVGGQDEANVLLQGLGNTYLELAEAFDYGLPVDKEEKGQ